MKPNPRHQPAEPAPATPDATLIDVERPTPTPRRWRRRRNARIGALPHTSATSTSMGRGPTWPDRGPIPLQSH